MKKAIILFIILLNCFCVVAQKKQRASTIKVKGDYFHHLSGTLIPKTINDNYARIEIKSFDRQKKNIGVTYQALNGSKVQFTIYIYPAGSGTEGRLRSQYLTSLQAMANRTRNGIHADSKVVQYKGAAYDCNGIKGISNSNRNELSTLSVYECGTWFFKIRINAKPKDSTSINKLEDIILNKFTPSQLTKKKELNEGANVYLSPRARKDSFILKAIAYSANKKIEWAEENIPRRERASGFPDLYLAMHMESFKEFLKVKDDRADDLKDPYIKKINKLNRAGYLDEYIMEKYQMILKVPEGHQFNFKQYETWKKRNNISSDINVMLAVIEYDNK